MTRCPTTQGSPQELLELNRSCYCFPITRDRIDKAILELSQHPNMAALLATRENYFASTAVFLSQADLTNMLGLITTIEQTIEMEPYQQSILTRTNIPSHAVQSRTMGAFMAYDFHITPSGPRLIEINTNGGGAFIVNALEHSIGSTDNNTESKIAQMFQGEWHKSGRTGRPKTVAIVDENPTEQYHYPDMCLAADSLHRQGFNTVIADPADLTFDGITLHVGETVIDLVYNRLTDFNLTDPTNAALQQALARDSVVVTPNPRHHALYADKRNLVLLSDMDQLERWGVSASAREILSSIPTTQAVTADTADALWSNRRQYFFKPNAGFGSRAAYRGSKLTKKTWRYIMQGGYVAQAFVAPPLRAVTREAGKAELKFDIRVYSYDAKPLLLAARVYQGQTTNLRTDGGGLAPVIAMETTVLDAKPNES